MNKKDLILFFGCFIFPLAIYIYLKNAKRGLVVYLLTTAGLVLGLHLISLAFNVLADTMILLIAGSSMIFLVYGFLIYDSVRLVLSNIKLK